MRPNFNLFPNNPFDKYRQMPQNRFSEPLPALYGKREKPKSNFWPWAFVFISVGYLAYKFRDKIFDLIGKAILYFWDENAEQVNLEKKTEVSIPNENTQKQLPEASKDQIIFKTKIPNENKTGI
jgi:hypothetical protein